MDPQQTAPASQDTPQAPLAPTGDILGSADSLELPENPLQNTGLPASADVAKTNAAANPAKTSPNRSLYTNEGKYAFVGQSQQRKLALIFIIILGALLAIAGAAAFVQNKRSAPETPVAMEQELTSIPANDLSVVETPSLSSASRIQINGPLEVKNQFVLSPSERPSDAQSGQIYFDSTDRTFVYFDGQEYRTITTADEVLQNNQAISGEISTSIAEQNEYIDNVVRSLQSSTGAVNLSAGSGIGISGLQISNAGVTQLQGTPNQVIVSASTGTVRVSLPQDIHTGASPVFDGMSLSTLNVSGSSVLGTLHASSISLDNALGIEHGGTGAGSSDFSTNGVVFFDGDKLTSTPTASAPDLCLISTTGAPVFAPCDNALANSVSSLNGLTGHLNIANSSAAGTTITIDTASQNTPGLLSEVAQRVGGLKTFTGGISFTMGSTISSEHNLSIQPAQHRDLTLGTSGSGRLILSAMNCTTQANGGKLTVDANGVVICAEDTGGDGVGLGSISAADNSVSIDNTDGNNPQISVNARTNGGLNTTAGGLGLVDTCDDDQVLKYTTAGGWICANDEGTNDGGGCPACVALQSSSPGIAQNGHINITGSVLGGSASFGGSVAIKPPVEATDTFQLQNAIGDTLINGNTQNMSVTIGSLASPTTAEIYGTLPGTTTYASINNGNGIVNYVVPADTHAYVITNSSRLYALDISNRTASPTVVFNESMGSGTLTDPIMGIASGDYLYILDEPNTSSGSIRVFDISNRANPTLVTSVTTGRYPVDMTMHNNKLYIVSNESSSLASDHIYTFDLSNPALPVSIGDTSIGSVSTWPTAITADNNMLYVTDRGLNQLISFDPSDPNDITELDTITTGTAPNDVSVYGDRAYVTNSNAGNMQTFDVSNPASMQLTDTTDESVVYSNPSGVFAQAGYVMVVTYYGGPDNAYGYLQLFSTDDPDDPQLVGSKPLLGRGVSFSMQDGVAYVANYKYLDNSVQSVVLGAGATTLQVYGGSDMTGDLSIGGDFSGSGNGTFSGTVSASNLQSLGYVRAQTFDTVASDAILAIGGPNANAISLNQNTTIATGRSLIVQGSTTITTDSASALQVKDSSDDSYLLIDTDSKNVAIGSTNAPTTNTGTGGSLSDHTIGKTNISSVPNSVVLDGDYAYVASAVSSNLQIVNISDPENPTLAGATPTMFGQARGIAVKDGIAYLAVGTNKVEIFDVSNPAATPSALSIIDTRNTSTSVQSVLVEGDYLYVAYIGASPSFWGYVERWDISNPGSPTAVGNPQVVLASSARLRMTTSEDRLYVVSDSTGTNSGMRIFNTSNPAATTLPSTNHLMNGKKPSSVAVRGGYAFIPQVGTSYLDVYDVSAIAGTGVLTPVNTLLTGNNPSDVAISDSGSFLYVTDATNNNLIVYSLADPIAPQSVGSVDTSDGMSTAQTVAADTQDGVVAVVNSSRSNLLIVDLTGSAPRIALNQNTVLHTGRTFTAQGDTTIKTDSDSAFLVQNAAGNNVLSVNTNTGVVAALSGFSVNGTAGLSASCTSDETLINIVIVGGIVTAGNCGSGGDGSGGASVELDENGGILLPSVDTKLGGETLTLGPNNAAAIVLNQDTTLAAGKTLTVTGDTTLAHVAMNTLTVADAEANQFLTIDAEGLVTIGAPIPAAPPAGSVPGSDLAMSQSATGQVNFDAAASDMIAVGEYVYVTYAAANKLETYQVSSSGVPSLVDTLSLTNPKFIAVEGTRMFITTDYQIYEVDITTPGDPTYKWATASTSAYGMGTHASIAISNSRIYSISSTRAMLAYNAANPASAPGLTAAAGNKVNGTARSIAGGTNGRIYAVDNSAGFQAIRVFTADGQVNQSGYFNLTLPSDVTIHGDYLYVLSNPDGTGANGKMEIYEIATTPNAPVKVGEVATDAEPIDIRISDNGLFAAIANANSSTIQTVDISDPSSPVSLGSIALGTAPSITSAGGDYAFVISNSGQHLDVFSVDEPAAPTGPAPDPEFGIKLNSNVLMESGNAIHLHGDTTIRTDSETAFQIQNTAQANLLSVDTLSGNINIGLKVVDGPSTPVFDAPEDSSALSTTSTGTQRPSAIARKDQYVYLAMRDTQGNNIRTYNVSDPENPAETGNVTVNDPIKVTVRGNYLYAISPANVYVLSLANPAEPALVATLSGPGGLSNLKDFTATDTHLYIYDGSSYKIATIDITDPENPVYQSTQPGSGSLWTNLYTVATSGNHAYTVDNFLYHKLFVFDLADPDNPAKLAFEENLANGVRAIATYNNHLYILNGTTKVLDVYDLTDPAAPTKITEASLSLPAVGTAQSMIVSEDGRFAAIHDTASGGSVHIINLTTPTAPTYLGAVVSASPTAVTTDANNIYVVSNTNQTMAIYQVSTTPAPLAQPNVSVNNNMVVAEGQTLTVQGDTTIKTDSEAALSVQTADGSSLLSVNTVDGSVLVSGSLEVASLTVTGATSLASLTVSSDAVFMASITVNGHIITGGTAPTTVVQTPAGTDATCSISGNDTSGTITIVAGTDSLADGNLCVATFAAAFANTPKAMVSSVDKASAELGAFASADTTSFTLGATNAPAASQTYQFNYWVAQ